MHTESILKSPAHSGPEKSKKRVYRIPEINEDYWNTTALFLLIATVFWHLQALTGWLNGSTLVRYFGIDSVLANAISKSPDILFYATYFAMGLSVIMLIVTLVVLYFFFCDECDTHLAVKTVVSCSLASIWAFPVIHAITDLTASAIIERDTTGFDVFQLGINAGPLVLASVVCIAILWLNKRINILT